MASKNTLLKLPQLKENWFVTIETVEGYPSDGKKQHKEILTIVLISVPEAMQAIGLEIFPAAMVQEDQILDLIVRSIQKPEKTLRMQPHRPALIGFESKALVNQIGPQLEELGIQSVQAPVPEEVSVLLSGLKSMLFGGQNSLEGLLEIPDISVDDVKNLFKAAAAVYRAAPWKKLANTQVIGVRIQPEFELEPHPLLEQESILSVMGYGEMEYGIIWFQHLDDFISALDAGPHAADSIPEHGWRSLSYEKIKDAPEEDQRDQRKYRWELAGPKAFPVFSTVFQVGFSRPDAIEISFWEAVLQALPHFMESLILNDEDDFQPVELSIPVQGLRGKYEITLIYRGEDQTLPDEYWTDEFDEFSPDDELYLEFFDEDADPADQDAGRHESFGHIMAAQAEEDPAIIENLARQALQAWPDCAAAYLLLGDEVAQTADEAATFYQQAIQAGERAMGLAFIEEHMGDLGEIGPARSYLLARERLVTTLAEQQRHQEALEHALKGLSMDQEDHLGFRYSALALLLLLKRNDEAIQILERYEEDEYCAWPFSWALIHFRTEGASARAEESLKNAVRSNRHVVAYLTGRKPLPESLPEINPTRARIRSRFLRCDPFCNLVGNPGSN